MKYGPEPNNLFINSEETTTFIHFLYSMLPPHTYDVPRRDHYDFLEWMDAPKNAYHKQCILNLNNELSHICDPEEFKAIGNVIRACKKNNRINTLPFSEFLERSDAIKEFYMRNTANILYLANAFQAFQASKEQKPQQSKANEVEISVIKIQRIDNSSRLGEMLREAPDENTSIKSKNLSAISYLNQRKLPKHDIQCPATHKNRSGKFSLSLDTIEEVPSNQAKEQKRTKKSIHKKTSHS